MKSKVDLLPIEWDWVWYWIRCYECPNSDVCNENNLCEDCKKQNLIERKSQGLK